ncbi:MAG: hypothetical protein M3P51_08010 [Chloroflexota bacterium]|nr:hypothetical protein [Chloroflexota bacterium]
MKDDHTTEPGKQASYPGSISVDEATKVIKEYAAAQRVEIKLTEDQMQAILDQWQLDPSRPFELSFLIEGRESANLKVASCAYWGDTCCA